MAAAAIPLTAWDTNTVTHISITAENNLVAWAKAICFLLNAESQ